MTTPAYFKLSAGPPPVPGLPPGQLPPGLFDQFPPANQAVQPTQAGPPQIWQAPKPSFGLPQQGQAAPKPVFSVGGMSYGPAGATPTPQAPAPDFQIGPQPKPQPAVPKPAKPGYFPKPVDPRIAAMATGGAGAFGMESAYRNRPRQAYEQDMGSAKALDMVTPAVELATGGAVARGVLGRVAPRLAASGVGRAAAGAADDVIPLQLAQQAAKPTSMLGRMAPTKDVPLGPATPTYWAGQQIKNMVGAYRGGLDAAGNVPKATTWGGWLGDMAMQGGSAMMSVPRALSGEGAVHNAAKALNPVSGAGLGSRGRSLLASGFQSAAPTIATGAGYAMNPEHYPEGYQSPVDFNQSAEIPRTVINSALPTDLYKKLQATVPDFLGGDPNARGLYGQAMMGAEGLQAVGEGLIDRASPGYARAGRHVQSSLVSDDAINAVNKEYASVDAAYQRLAASGVDSPELQALQQKRLDLVDQAAKMEKMSPNPHSVQENARNAVGLERAVGEARKRMSLSGPSPQDSYLSDRVNGPLAAAIPNAVLDAAGNPLVRRDMYNQPTTPNVLPGKFDRANAEADFNRQMKTPEGKKAFEAQVQSVMKSVPEAAQLNQMYPGVVPQVVAAGAVLSPALAAAGGFQPFAKAVSTPGTQEHAEGAAKLAEDPEVQQTPPASPPSSEGMNPAGHAAAGIGGGAFAGVGQHVMDGRSDVVTPSASPQQAQSVWDSLGQGSKMLVYGGLSLATVGLLYNLFGGGDDEDGKPGGMGFFSTIAPLLGLGIAGAGLAGQHKSMDTMMPDFTQLGDSKWWGRLGNDLGGLGDAAKGLVGKVTGGSLFGPAK